MYAWDGATGEYVLINLVNYKAYTTLTYYYDITDCDALDSYNLSGSYTVLYGVPEPATYALFGGIGALGLALLRRRKSK